VRLASKIAKSAHMSKIFVFTIFQYGNQKTQNLTLISKNLLEKDRRLRTFATILKEEKQQNSLTFMLITFVEEFFRKLFSPDLK
jgi:hypothetical protein